MALIRGDRQISKALRINEPAHKLDRCIVCRQGFSRNSGCRVIPKENQLPCGHGVHASAVGASLPSVVTRYPVARPGLAQLWRTLGAVGLGDRATGVEVAPG